MTDPMLPTKDDTKPEPSHTENGAPTDGAHAEAGDGSSAGSVPAGLTVDELLKQAEEGGGNEGGAG